MLRGEPRPKRFGAERGERRPQIERCTVNQIDRAEPARIAQRQNVTGPGPQHQVIVLADFLGVNPPAPRHAEMEHQRPLAVCVNQAVLGTAVETGDCRTGQGLDEIGGKRRGHDDLPRETERQVIERLVLVVHERDRGHPQQA